MANNNPEELYLEKKRIKDEEKNLRQELRTIKKKFYYD